MDRLSGIGVSPGVAVGRAVILTQRTEVMRFPIPPDRVDREVQALGNAREESKSQLQDIRERLAQLAPGERDDRADAKRLGDHHRAVPPAGAADRDRQVRLALGDVAVEPDRRGRPRRRQRLRPDLLAGGSVHGVPEPVHGSTRRRPILGGLINEYEPAAA